MNNPMSSSGIGEDILRSIVQFGCAEVHAKTLYEKTRAEIENGIIDIENKEVRESALEKMEEYRQDMGNYAQLRRRAMLSLYKMFEGDKDMWCQIKHLGVASYTLLEAYEASDEDMDLFDLAYDANKEFVKAVTRFLGIGISDCSACLSDFLKAGGEKDEHSQTVHMR